MNEDTRRYAKRQDGSAYRPADKRQNLVAWLHFMHEF